MHAVLSDPVQSFVNLTLMGKRCRRNAVTAMVGGTERNSLWRPLLGLIIVSRYDRFPGMGSIDEIDEIIELKNCTIGARCFVIRHRSAS